MKKIFTVLGMGALLLIMAAGLSSCEGDKYYYEGAGFETRFFNEVQPNDWTWNEGLRRMEVKYRDNYIADEYLYNEGGAFFAGVYINEVVNGRNQETYCSLPYVFTSNENGSTFTTNMGFEVTLANGGQVLFYIQASDLRRFTVEETYTFKVALVWEQ